jgi:hypothetical protein
MRRPTGSVIMHMDGYFGDHRQAGSTNDAFIRTDDQAEKALEVLLLRVCHVCMRIPDEVSSSICSRQCYIECMGEIRTQLRLGTRGLPGPVEPRFDRM